ncbi:hypothetical protein BDW22DRAFT_1343994 [Trametopsis cervina]|nr:hypothetical protein BDW22DRAFT_1343994 [Trametopsis cervina]
MCGLWLPISTTNAINTVEGVEQVGDHFSRCLSLLKVKLGIDCSSKPSANDSDESDISNGEHSCNDDGKLGKNKQPLESKEKQKGRQTVKPRDLSVDCWYNLSCQILISPSQIPRTRSQRLRCKIRAKALHEHLGSHWTIHASPLSSFEYKRTAECYWPRYLADNHGKPLSFPIKGMLEHLYNHHHYQLLICNTDHDHPDEEVLILPERFMYQTKALARHELDMQSADQSVCVIDAQKPARRKQVASRLAKANAKAHVANKHPSELEIDANTPPTQSSLSIPLVALLIAQKPSLPLPTAAVAQTASVGMSSAVASLSQHEDSLLSANNEPQLASFNSASFATSSALQDISPFTSSVTASTNTTISSAPTVSSSTSVATMPVSALAYTFAAASSASTALMQPLSESISLQSQLAHCLPGFFKEYPQYDRPELLQRFQHEKITIEDLLDPVQGAKTSEFCKEFEISYAESMALTRIHIRVDFTGPLQGAETACKET